MWAATYDGGVAGGLVAIYHNDTNHFTVQFFNIEGAATYGGGAADGCIAIYHNDTNPFTATSIF